MFLNACYVCYPNLLGHGGGPCFRPGVGGHCGVVPVDPGITASQYTAISSLKNSFIYSKQKVFIVCGVMRC